MKKKLLKIHNKKEKALSFQQKMTGMEAMSIPVKKTCSEIPGPCLKIGRTSNHQTRPDGILAAAPLNEYGADDDIRFCAAAFQQPGQEFHRIFADQLIFIVDGG